MTNMHSQSHELFGIRRSTILIISIALAIGSFSAWKAVGGGSATAARISVSGTALAAGGDKSPSFVAGLQTEPHSSTVRSPAAQTAASLGSAILTKADADTAHRPTKPHPAVKTDLIPIEQIQVGDRVLAESPTGEEDTAFGSEIIPSAWRKLTLRAPKRDGTTAEVVLLRPLTWLNEQRTGRSRLPSGIFAARRTDVRHLSDELGTDSGTTGALHGRDTSRNPARQAGPTVESQTVEDMVGGTVFISVPECGIDGNAEVLAIDPCPEILSGAGRVVTGTFLHQARSTITLKIARQSEPIECTGNHPFWSEDRQTFVRADSLQPNETLRTATGLTTVESWTPDLNPTPVHNIEVHGAHVYHVGTSGVVVHNSGLLPIIDPCFLPDGPVVGLGVRRDLDGLRRKFSAILYDKWAERLGTFDPVNDPDSFGFAFGQATEKAKVIVFSLDNFDIPRALREGGKLLPDVTTTSWEFLQIFEKGYVGKTLFVRGGKFVDIFDEFKRLGLPLPR